MLEANLTLLDDDTTIDIIVYAFGIMDDSNRQEAAERIVDVMTPEQREALIEYIKEG